MGSWHSVSPPHTTTTTTTTTTIAAQENSARLRREFDKLFADMEFRSKRAAMMNYHESERFEKRARLLNRVTMLVGALSVSGIARSVAKTAKVTASRTGLAGVLGLPVVALLEFISNGSSSLGPTVAEKAQKHTEAGAGWQRIARVTRGYRVQLRCLPDDDLQSPMLSAWYREVVEASEQVSKILPIRSDTYLLFDEPHAVKQRLDKREGLLRQYIDMEAASERR